ncbi:hypothetical protein ES703_66321 [subsurface metagenome]
MPPAPSPSAYPDAPISPSAHFPLTETESFGHKAHQVPIDLNFLQMHPLRISRNQTFTIQFSQQNEPDRITTIPHFRKSFRRLAANEKHVHLTNQHIRRIIAINNTNINPAATQTIRFKKRRFAKKRGKLKGGRNDESNISFYESAGISKANGDDHSGACAAGMYERFSTFDIKTGQAAERAVHCHR